MALYDRADLERAGCARPGGAAMALYDRADLERALSRLRMSLELPR
jgi:hypothetical protein